MKIIVVAPPGPQAEFRVKFTAPHEYFFAETFAAMESHLASSDVVFDFLPAPRNGYLAYYERPHLAVFCETTFVSLADLVHAHGGREPQAQLFGFCGLPTLLNRPVLEASLWRPTDQTSLASVCNQLVTEFAVVADRVGLVTPRVLSLLINEAFYTLQEGTANLADIDLSLKLGTNYPHGPFEWAARLGIATVYQILNAVYEDSRDERYRICPLLKRAYLTNRLP